MFSLICDWTTGWASNQNDGDLRRHRAHNDLNVAETESCHGADIFVAGGTVAASDDKVGMMKTFGFGVVLW